MNKLLVSLIALLASSSVFANGELYDPDKLIVQTSPVVIYKPKPVVIDRTSGSTYKDSSTGLSYSPQDMYTPDRNASSPTSNSKYDKYFPR